MSLADILGDEVLTKDGVVKTSTITAECVALYFSAHWCPPCRQTTPLLAEWYKKMKAAGKDLEIVFVSSDRDQKTFEEYYGEMPWMAMPFEQRDLKNKLSSKLKIKGIPTLAFANQKGEVYETNGRAIFMQDSEGKDFPWVPPTIEEALGTEFIKNDGSKVQMSDIKGAHIALLFSASWCGPCRQFQKPLVECYNAVQEAGKNWQVILVGADQTKDAFEKYFSHYPFLAIPFGDDRNDKLNSIFKVEGIPTMIQLDPEFQVLNAALRGAIMNDPSGKEFPWEPKPVQSIEEGAGEINDLPALIALMENESPTTQAQFGEILSSIAEVHKPKVKAKQADEALFLTAGSSNPIVAQIRKLTKLTDAKSEGVRTLCNGDFCMKINPTTTVILLDIPDQGGFYVMDKELTKENVTSFFNDYLAGNLKDARKQLSQ